MKDRLGPPSTPAGGIDSGKIPEGPGLALQSLDLTMRDINKPSVGAVFRLPASFCSDVKLMRHGRDRPTQVVRLGDKCRHPLSHLNNPTSHCDPCAVEAAGKWSLQV